ncbi:MAG: sulfotransferase [Pirellulaceae bacterium]
MNSVFAALELIRFRSAWQAVSVQPPLFILGHYRHGTTHLHNLLSLDDRFGFPNMFQVSYPNTFLTTEALSSVIANFFVPLKRPFDNVPLGMSVPYEDEIAMVSAARVSPYLSLVFPRRISYYDGHLSLQNASVDDISRWQNALLTFFQKLTLKHNKPLVIKSPPHTARIPLLLEMFPEAKFVHICRNPYDVYQSTMKMVTIGSRWTRLQTDAVDLRRRTISTYREMYDAYFDDRELIPSGNLHEMSFEDLQERPIDEIERMYRRLGLPEFFEVEHRLRDYLRSIASYERNRFSPLDERDAALIRSEWSRSFGEWGYSCP